MDNQEKKFENELAEHIKTHVNSLPDETCEECLTLQRSIKRLNNFTKEILSLCAKKVLPIIVLLLLLD
jgi:hypothetical protein